MTPEPLPALDLPEPKRLPFSRGLERRRPHFWRMKTFRSNSAASKMLALMLAHESPRALLNGQRIDIDKSLAWSNYYPSQPPEAVAESFVQEGFRAVRISIVNVIARSGLG